MKSKTNSQGQVSFFFTALFSILMSLNATAQVQLDSFDDGNDEGWERFSALDVVGASSVFSFPESPGGGHAYRLQSPAPAVDAAGPARSFTNLPQVYTNFYAAVDVMDWDNEVNQAFVEVTFDPPWNPEMISEEARKKLGVGVSGPQERQESNINTEWE